MMLGWEDARLLKKVNNLFQIHWHKYNIINVLMSDIWLRMTRLSFHLNICGSQHSLNQNRSAKSQSYIAIPTPHRELAEDRGRISAINKF